MIWPSSFGRETIRASRRFGADRLRHTHRGVDLRGPGALVLAWMDGRVKAVLADTPGPGSVPAAPGAPVSPGTGGVVVVLDHGGGLESRYMHLASVAVSTGATVRAGDTIGGVGRSGFRTGSTTEDHLHFEILDRGQHVDPLPLLASAQEGGATAGLVLAAGLVVIGLLLGWVGWWTV